MCRRIIAAVTFMGAKVQDAEYNPGLGKVVKNAYDRSEQAKRQGLQEVGNDYSSGEKMDKEFTKDRKKKLDKSWDDIL